MRRQRIGPHASWEIQGEPRLTEIALILDLDRVEDAEGHADDLTAIHQIAADVLQDFAHAQPTVLIVPKHTQIPPAPRALTAAGTWARVKPEDPPKDPLDELSSPFPGQVNIQPQTHNEVIKALKELARQRPDAELTPWLRFAADEEDPFVRLANHAAPTTLDELRDSIATSLRDALEAVVQRRPSSSDARTIAAEHTNAAAPPRRSARSLSMQGVGNIKELTLDLSHDVTLIVGPNAVGKTTITRALAAALCGYEMPGFASRPDTKIEVCFGDDAPPLQWSASERRHARGPTLTAESAWRLSVLSDEHVDKVLKGQGLETPSLSVLQPTAVIADIIREIAAEDPPPGSEEARAARGPISRRAQELDENDDEARALAVRQRDWKERLSRLEEAVGPVLRDTSLPGVDELRSLLARARDGRDDAPADIAAWLARRALTAGGVASDPEAMLDELGEVRRELKRLEGQLEPLTSISEWLGAPDARGVTALERALDALIEARATLTRREGEPPRGPVRRIVDELKRMDPEAIEGLRREARAALRDDRELRARRAALEHREREIVGALTQADGLAAIAEAVKAVEAWRDSPGPSLRVRRDALDRAQRAADRAADRESERTRLAALRAQLHEAAKALQPTSDHDVIRALNDALNRLLSRNPAFSRSGAATKVELRPGPRLIVDDDTRSIDTLSTGQRHQLALAWIVAQRLVFDASNRADELGHRLLVLDDLSSANDPDTIGREILLLRQLAYQEDRQRSVQLVILTHDDDLADRYLRSLAPPHGRSMGFTELSLSADGAVQAAERSVARDEPLNDQTTPRVLRALNEALRCGREEHS